MEVDDATEGGVLVPIEEGPEDLAESFHPRGSMVRQVFRLSAPVLVEQSLLYLVGLSDTLLTGRYLSEGHLAAVTVATYLLWFLGSLMTIISVGATALVARFTGAANPEAANRTCQQAVGLALILGTVVLFAGQFAAPSLIRALNLKGQSADRRDAVPSSRPSRHARSWPARRRAWRACGAWGIPGPGCG